MASSSEKTPAQLMAERHNENHHAMVEDAIDEDDVQHPPPSHSLEPSNGGTNGLMSAKAAGKQKESNKPSVLDTQSEEAFPSLGPSAKAPAASAPSWGSRGPLRPTSQMSSGFPTPPTTPGAMTPSSASSRVADKPISASMPTNRNTPSVALPGKYRDYLEIAVADINKEKGLERVLQDVRRKFKVNAFSEEGRDPTIRRFVAEGQKQLVTDALRQVSKEISVPRTIKMEVLSSVSAAIIGKGGQNINRLRDRYGVNIQFDKGSRSATSAADEPRLESLEIRGDSAGVRLAHEEIKNLVKQNQPKVNLPLRNVPPEFYTFLKARHGDRLAQLEDDQELRIQIPHYHTWSNQAPPRPERDGIPPVYVPHGDSHIVVSGEQEAATRAKKLIEEFTEQLQRELLLSEITAEQVLHPYTVGERGMDPIEFYKRTGCALILPPPHVETDDIHIIGPADRIESGKELAEQLMAAKSNRALDLQKHFAKAPTGPNRHSRALARYLQQRAIHREFEQSHGAEIVFPVHSDASPTWNIITNDPQKSLAARNELMKIMQAFPPSRIDLVPIDPFFHPHLTGMHANNLRQQHGVHMVAPEGDDEHVILIYEGPHQTGPSAIPRQRPTAPEEAAFKQALGQARAQLLGSIPSGPIASDNMDIPRKHHDRMRRFIQATQTPQDASLFPVQVEFGGIRDQQNRRGDSVLLRGPSNQDIAELRKAIESHLIKLEQDEKERNYTTSFDFPQNFVKNLVGKQGQNIQKLREKYDVEIDTREPGKVTVQGPPVAAEACKAEIIKIGKALADEVNYVVKVDPRFHGELIGRNGENLHKLQDKVNNEVRIDFPRVSKQADDQSVADGASEAGAVTRQAPDEVRIRGPRAKADKVRDELLSLHQYLQDNAFTATVSVARDQIASLIGRGGSGMERLRAETGAQIEVPNKTAEGERVTLMVKGTKQQVEKARQELAKRAKAFDEIVTKTITVDRKFHGELIGAGGANIKRIVLEAGGPEQSAEAVKFPRHTESSSELTIKGKHDVVEKIVASIRDFVGERESAVEEVVDVPIDQHRNLIGAGGAEKRRLEELFKVSLNIPRRDSGKTGVTIAGQPAAVASAKSHIIGKTKTPSGAAIDVPLGAHHLVSKNGRLFQELSRKGIKIDHRGQQAPPKAQAGAPRLRTMNGATPLITDEPGQEAHSWEIVQTGGAATDEDGTIPWVLSGNASVTDEQIAQARSQIEAAIQRAQTPQHTGYLILPDPGLHRRVIGKGGATINRIRKSTGCDIQVPKPGDQTEAITIVGGRAEVLSAKDLILEELAGAGEF